MIRLRKILLCNFFFYLILILSIILCFIRLNIGSSSVYSSKSNSFIGIVTDIEVNGNELILRVKDNCGESIKGYYYFDTQSDRDKAISILKLGIKVEVMGEFSHPSGNRVPNTFNYRKYLQRNNIFFCVSIKSINVLDNNISLFYKIKNMIIKYFDSFKSGRYLKILILGISCDVDSDVLLSYREIGVSHLFAISGTQVTVVGNVILAFLKRVKCSEKSRYLLVNIFILFYLFLTGFQAAILRAVIFFILNSINKIYYFYVKQINVFYLTLAITILVNPNYIFDLGFQYSYLISFVLILMSNRLDNCNYFMSLIKTSFYSFLVSVPITLYNFYQINLLSIVYNLFFVPYVSYILFPLSFIVLVLPFLDQLLEFLIYIMESVSLLISNVNLFKIIFPKIPFIFYIVYFVFFLFFYLFRNRISYFIFCFFCLFHYNYYNLFKCNLVSILDVGQGDSTLVLSEGEAMLIDTGGKINYSSYMLQDKKSSSIVLNSTVLYMKSLGIRRLKKLVLTHGDYDHLGEALLLLDNFKVDEVLINEGSINTLERSIIRKRDDVKILKQNDTFCIGNFSFLSLNKDMGDENSSSIVLFGNYKDINFLFMGDASIKSEHKILNYYDLPIIDFIKIGHHGSRTGTSDLLLDSLRPKIALISAGRKNKFSHPHKDVIEKLNKYGVKYLNTADYGTITLNLDKMVLKSS